MKGKFKTIKEIQKEMDKITNEYSSLEVPFSVGLKHTELFAMSKQTKQICKMIEGLQRWDAVEMKVGVGMKKNKKGYFIEYYELLSKIRGADGGRS